MESLTLAVELVAKQPIHIDAQRLQTELARACGPVDVIMADDQKQAYSFGYHNYRAEFTDGSGPVSTFMTIHNLDEQRPTYEASFQQSWGWPNARAVVGQCRHSLMVMDMFGGGLPPMRRLELFGNVLRVLLAQGRYEGIHFKTSQQFLAVEAYQAAVDSPFFGFLNVRMFNIANDPSQKVMLMDSMGMQPFGLPDTQCHFQGLDPNRIAPIVFNIAAYLLQSGDVIEDGHTVPGIAPDSKWRCQHEMSLVKPERLVLDINPGAPYAAGERG
jgi:hypothetical protein